jgi:hypothetical protein
MNSSISSNVMASFRGHQHFDGMPIVNKQRSGEIIDVHDDDINIIDVHDDDDDDDSTTSSAWSFTCSYDADCEQSSNNNNNNDNFQSTEKHHGVGGDYLLLHHHLGSTGTVASSAHAHAVMTTNPWHSSLPAMTLNDDISSTTDSATPSTTSNASAAAARRHRLLHRRHRQQGRFTARRRGSTSTSLSSFLSFMESHENDDAQQTDDLIISSTSPSPSPPPSPTFIAELAHQDSSMEQQSSQAVEQDMDDSDDDSHTSYADSDDDVDEVRSRGLIPLQIHVTMQQHGTVAMVGAFVPATPFQAILGAFCTRDLAHSDSILDDNGDSDSLSIEDCSENQNVAYENVLAPRIGVQTEGSEQCTQYSLDGDEDDCMIAVGEQQDNNSSRTGTVPVLVEHGHDMQEPASKREVQQPVLLETASEEPLAGPLVGLTFGLQLLDLSHDQQKDDRNTNLLEESTITKEEEEPPVLFNSTETESTPWRPCPSIHVSSQGEVCAAGVAVDTEWSAAEVDNFLLWMERSSTSWVSTSSLESQDEDDSVCDSIAVRVAEAVLAEADDDAQVDMQGHDSRFQGCSSEPCCSRRVDPQSLQKIGHLSNRSRLGQ